MKTTLFLATATKLVPVKSYAAAARACSEGDIYRACECGCGKPAGKPVKVVRNRKVVSP